MNESRKLVLSAVLALIFSIALFFVSLWIIHQINQIMAAIIPDYGIGETEEQELIIQSLMPFGLIALAATIVLIVMGLAMRRGWLAVTGSAALYLPVFGSFSGAMFFLAGIGALRVLWLPVIEINPAILRLGDVFLSPYFLLVGLVQAGILACPYYSSVGLFLAVGLMLLGITVFTLGTIAWLYARFRNLALVDFWVYRYSRHPQYLGYLVWSYGFLLSVPFTPVPPGGMYLVPSLPWLVGALVIVGISLGEETKMLQERGEVYATYRSITPFLVPLPRMIVNFVQAPMRYISGSNLPGTNRGILGILLFYGILLSAISIPFVWL